jgi:DNA-binding MarR family transcriptional regulator
MTPRRQPRKSLRSDALKLLAECAGLNSRLAARRITQFIERDLGGVTLAPLGLMAQIAAASDDTIAGLAMRTGLDQSTLSRSLRALESDGLVEITIVESDLRRRAVWLTEKGARRLEQAVPVWREANATLSRHVDTGLARRLARETEGLP